MTDLLGDGVAWQIGRLEDGASVSMTYRRGANSVVLSVTRGQSEYTTYDDEGNLVTEVTDADFLVTAADLILDSAVVLPVAGDRIELVVGATTRYYEVMPRGNRRPYSLDPTRQLLRIHTKFIKVA